MRILHPVLAAVLLAGAACNRTSDGTGGPADYEAAFVTDRIVTWNITVSGEDWDHLVDVDPESYVPADVEVDGASYREVGLRLMGDPAATRKSLRIRFNAFRPGQEFHGLKRINLRNMADDPSLVREALAYRLMRDAGVPASRTSFVWVCINGGPCGLHTQVEQVDKKFMEDRFDGDDAGNIYKVERGGYLVYRGEDPSDYSELHVYEKKTNVVENDYSDLIGLMRVLSEEASLETQLPTVLDVDGFLTALAVNTWLANLNSYQGTSDNMYLYRDSAGIFHYIPWDLNGAFGNHHADPSDTCYLTTDGMIELDPVMPVCDPGYRPLVENVLAVDSFLATYRSRMRALMGAGGVLEPSAVTGAMSAMKAHIQDRAAADELLFPFDLTDFNDSFSSDIENADHPPPDRIPGLEPFVGARDAFIRSRL